MRTFTTAVQNIINNDQFKYFFLIKLSLNNTYYFTSHWNDITYDSQTWISDGGMFEVDSPKFSSILDREAYRVVITDLVDQIGDEFRTGVVGKPIQVFVGFLDANNDPLLGTGDIINIYSGFVDTPTVENTWETKLASIEGTSPMSDLDSINLFMVSKDGMDQRSSTDTSFDKVFEDSEINIKWGKK